MRVLHAGDDAEIREYMSGNFCRIDHTSEINGHDRVKYAPARDISELAVPAAARVQSPTRGSPRLSASAKLSIGAL